MHFLDLVEMIRARREMLQVTQETLAELSGVGLRTIKEIERGKGNPTLSTVAKLAEVLGLEVHLRIKNASQHR